MKIGLEVHIALPSRSKIFCSCSTKAEEPNTAICPICLGFPGSKPMLNRAVVGHALSIAHALHCKINNEISFVRKVYFYPDLPKSYQITQMDGSIGTGGYLEIDQKKIMIRRIQIEEDPAKIVREGTKTLLDFNRSGIPLVEVVTEPDITSEEELWLALRSLRSILYYLGIEIENEIKADLNISLDGPRVEVKNVTGIKNLIEAAKYEIRRQSALVKSGGAVVGETRAYNEKRRNTVSLREKETDEEYGYVYEPDLTTFSIDGICHKEAVYAIAIAKELAKKHSSNARTIQELIMFDQKSLDRINKYRDNYEMQKIINGIERIKKYGKEGISDDYFKKILDLQNEDIIITKEIIEEVEKGKQVKHKTKKIDEKELDKLIREFLAKNSELIESYMKNKRVVNLIIGDISRENGLHPRDVAGRAIPIIEKLTSQRGKSKKRNMEESI